MLSSRRDPAMPTSGVRGVWTVALRPLPHPVQRRLEIAGKAGGVEKR